MNAQTNVGSDKRRAELERFMRDRLVKPPTEQIMSKVTLGTKMEDLEAAVEQLHEAFSRLEEQLIGLALPQQNGKGPGEVQPTESLYVTRIQAQTAHILAMIDDVHSLSSRLQV